MDQTALPAPDAVAAFLTTGGGQLVVLGLVFAAVALAVYGAASLAGGPAPARRLGAGGAPRADMAPRAGGGGRIAKMLEKNLTPSDLTTRSHLRLNLMRAGYMQPSAVAAYFAARIVLTLALPLPLIFLLPLMTRDIDSGPLLLGAAGLALAGYALPWVWVRMRGAGRIEEIRRGFPDALDLLLVCVEAGLGLDAAILRVGHELRDTHPALSEHLRLTSLEVRAGQNREDALRNLGKRCGVDEISAFVTLMIQSQELGTSIGDSLRVYADDMRYARMMKAEEKAAALPVKLSIPLVLLMLPAFMGVIMLPVIIRIIRILLPVGAGG